MTRDNDKRDGKSHRHINLHRSVLWALEINCLMQIERYVSDFGIKGNNHLGAEVTTARVDYESLRALNDMTAICRWVEDHTVYGEDERQHSLIDLAPLALRNVCAGLCVWLCHRSIDSDQPQSSGKGTLSMNPRRHCSANHLDIVQVLRDTAAKATSHKDTVDIIKCLDEKVAILQAALHGATRDK